MSTLYSGKLGPAKRPLPAVAPLPRQPLPDKEARILMACRKAEAQGFQITATFFGLELRDGVFAADGAPRAACLPLEALVLGRRSTGFFEQDVAGVLDVSWPWVSGFLMGFAVEPGVDAGAEGYQEGLAFRMNYYPAKGRYLSNHKE